MDDGSVGGRLQTDASLLVEDWRLGFHLESCPLRSTSPDRAESCEGLVYVTGGGGGQGWAGAVLRCACVHAVSSAGEAGRISGPPCRRSCRATNPCNTCKGAWGTLGPPAKVVHDHTCLSTRYMGISTTNPGIHRLCCFWLGGVSGRWQALQLAAATIGRSKSSFG